MKKILSLILGISAFSFVKAADSDWKIHTVFDEEVTHVVDSPDYVYFTGRQMMENSSKEVFLSLFRYDKKGEELMGLSTGNILNGNTVRDVIYNPDKGYLMVLYKDFDIDLLMNNGSVVNIPYFAQASMTQDKDVYSLSIDRNNDRIYLATDFGYVAINDKKNEVAESRIYNHPLRAFCRIGDKYVAIKDNDLIWADVSSPRLSLDQYDILSSFDNPQTLYPLEGNLCLLKGGSGANQYIKKLIFDADGLKTEDVVKGTIHNVENNSPGVLIVTNSTIYQVNKDGSSTSAERPESFKNSAAGSSNLAEVWNGQKRKGLSSIKKSGDSWSVTRDWMLPNSPATYASTSFVNHPSKGFMMLDYGNMPATASLYGFSPLQLSGYKQGRWTNYAPAYTNPDRTQVMTGSNGMAVDPNNPSYVYISSYHNGIVRLNLNNPQDIIHMSHANDADKGNNGFVVLPTHPTSSMAAYSNIGAPYFDSKGNLWMAFINWDAEDTKYPYMYCWTAEDLKATTSASDIKFPKALKFDVNISVRNTALAIPLLKTGNGLIVYANNEYNERIAMFDTNGTPVDTSDDKVYDFQSFTDNDGNSVDIQNTRYLWEDPYTGYVWICHANGICYFIPSQVRNGNYTVNKVKVSRNDGTNLADYLLEGVSVNFITSDGEGRKWIATAGGGVICTTADGREILEEFTASNSLLPDDTVYGIGYNPDNNSLMFSTAQGYAEYFLPSGQESSSKADVRAYPNPVRPEYSGYVTITDIPQGSFVKITDIKGNLVKELGIMSGFEMMWDVSDYNFNRVKAGVYHILVSPSDESSSYAAVGKILVIN